MDNEIKHLDQFAIESMVREACMSCGGVYLIIWSVIACVGGPRLWADLGEHLGQVRPGFCRNPFVRALQDAIETFIIINDT
jgi:hypothetical protein